MSTPTEPAPAPASDQEPGSAPEGKGSTKEPQSANAEAAKYRRQLRDTEVLLETANASLVQYQSDHAERIVADILAVPADIWDIGGGLQLAQCLSDDGKVNEDFIRDAAKALAAERPRLSVDGRAPGEGLFQGSRGPVDNAPAATWQNFITGNAQH